MAQLSDFEKASRIMADNGFESRVKGLLIQAALDIKGEAFDTVASTLPNGDPGPLVPTTRNTKRANLADQTLNDANNVLPRFKQAIAVAPGVVTKYATTIDADPEILGDEFEGVIFKQVQEAARAITDNDIADTIATLWDDLAGVNAWDSGKI